MINTTDDDDDTPLKTLSKFINTWLECVIRNRLNNNNNSTINDNIHSGCCTKRETVIIMIGKKFPHIHNTQGTRGVCARHRARERAKIWRKKVLKHVFVIFQCCFFCRWFSLVHSIHTHTRSLTRIQLFIWKCMKWEKIRLKSTIFRA